MATGSPSPKRRSRARGPAPDIDLSVETGESGEVKSILLLIEDDVRFAELVRYMLADTVPGFAVEHVTRLTGGLAAIVRRPVAVIVSDLHLPDSEGVGTVRHLRRAAPNVPLIVLTSTPDFNVAMECIHEGADEYVVKGTVGLQALGQVILLALERRRRLLERWAEEETPGPGGVGRATFESVGQYLLGVADRTGLHITVMFLRLDAGPAELGAEPTKIAAVTGVLRRTVRRCDVVARLDANELAVVLVMQQPDVHEAVGRLTREIVAAGANTAVRMGISSYHPGGRETVRDLVDQARQNLRPVPA